MIKFISSVTSFLVSLALMGTFYWLAFKNPDLQSSETPPHCFVMTEHNTICSFLAYPYLSSGKGIDITENMLKLFKFGFIINCLPFVYVALDFIYLQTYEK